MNTLKEISENLFFVVGCERSGTTLLQTILSCHEEILVAHETSFYISFYEKLEKFTKKHHLSPQDFPKVADHFLHLRQDFFEEFDLDQDYFKELCQNGESNLNNIFLAMLASQPHNTSIRKFGEKSPGHIHDLDFLSKQYPRAKFIHIMRDPRSIFLSCSKAQYKSRIKTARQLMHRWGGAVAVHQSDGQALAENRYLLIKYEDLVRTPETVIPPICEFLNVDFSSKMLQHHRQDQKNFTSDKLDHMQNTLKPIFTSSLDAWKEKLSPKKISVIQYTLKTEMEAMGYPVIDTGVSFPSVYYALSLLQYLPIKLKNQLTSSMN